VETPLRRVPRNHLSTRPHVEAAPESCMRYRPWGRGVQHRGRLQAIPRAKLLNGPVKRFFPLPSNPSSRPDAVHPLARKWSAGRVELLRARPLGHVPCRGGERKVRAWTHPHGGTPAKTREAVRSISWRCTTARPRCEPGATSIARDAPSHRGRREFLAQISAANIPRRTVSP
jgi:hypothetical protein